MYSLRSGNELCGHGSLSRNSAKIFDSITINQGFTQPKYRERERILAKNDYVKSLYERMEFLPSNLNDVFTQFTVVRTTFFFSVTFTLEKQKKMLAIVWNSISTKKKEFMVESADEIQSQ